MAEPRRPVDQNLDPGASDETQIRADERANMEQDLQAMQDDRTNRDAAAYDRDATVVAADEERFGEGRRDDRIEVLRTRSFSFGQLLTMLLGAALVVLGIFALIATGLDTPLDQPVESVIGYDHTPLLGIAEIVAGGLLLLFSVRPGGRWFVAIVGTALIVAGLVIFAELDWTTEELGAEQGYAWIPIVAGAAALLSSLLTPRRHQRVTGVPTDRLS